MLTLPTGTKYTKYTKYLAGLAALQKIPMKDFAAEIRAHMDVEQFLSQAQLMLDVQETEMAEILNCMLHHLLDTEESANAFQEAMKVLFTDSSGLWEWAWEWERELE